MSRGHGGAGQVLVVRTGAMGDVLHALAAVAALRAAWTEAEIDWVIDPRWAPLLVDGSGVGPVVSRVHPAETKLWSRAPVSRVTVRSVRGLRTGVRAAGYRAVVDLQGTLRSAVIGWFAEAKNYSGFADPRERAASLLYRQRLPRVGAHVAEQNTALLSESLGVRLQPARTLDLPREAGAALWAQRAVVAFAEGEPFALLAPAAGWGAKQWPGERFGELARGLAERGLAVLVNAAHEEEPTAQAVVAASGGKAIVVACGVAQLMALTRRAALVVGGDSGPVHLAAALGVPLVGLYGPTDPVRNGPWGAGPMRVLRHPASATSYKRTGTADAGLVQIAVDEVLEAVAAVCPLG